MIVHDGLVPEAVVAMGRRDAERIDVGKRKGAPFGHARTRSTRMLVREAAAGRRVVRLKAGDPLVFGRAGEEMAALRAAGIPFEIVPGVTSALAAAAEAEIPLTLRGTASSIVFATGQDAQRRRAAATGPAWRSPARRSPSIWAAPSRREVAARLMRGGPGAATPRWQ